MSKNNANPRQIGRQLIEVVIDFTRIENGDCSYNVKKSLLLEKNEKSSKQSIVVEISCKQQRHILLRLCFSKFYHMTMKPSSSDKLNEEKLVPLH